MSGFLAELRISWPPMAENGRILTTHVGSLPRPQDVVDVVFAEDKGEEVDPAGVRARDRRRGQGPRAAPGRCGRGHRQRRRDEQDRLRHLHPPSPERLRGRRRAARDPGRPRRLPELPRPARRRGRDGEVPAPDLPRPDRLREPRAAGARPRPPAQRDRRPARGRRVHERALAGDRRPLSAQRVLRHAPTSTSRHRRGDEDRVRGHRRGRLLPADRRARPRHGPPHHVPRRARRGLRRAGGGARRRDQPGAARRPARSRPRAPVLGQLRGPAPPRHRRSRRSSTTSCA